MSGRETNDLESITESVLVASRALVAVAARSLAGVTDDVTLPQFRAMVILHSKGPQRPGTLAEALALHPSTITRLLGPLHTRRLIRRRTAPADRREVEVSLTRAGEQIVDEVTSRRRAEIAAIVGRIPRGKRAAVIRGLEAFAIAAGEAPEQAWSIGWSS
jgi:DNA-binding MarR family transcriptional regulator